MHRHAGLVALALLATGCFSSLSHPVAGSTTASDEVWYVRERYVLFFRVQNDVFYCPPAQDVSAKVCTKAVLHDTP